MAEIFKFFNSGVGDPRWYLASDFADYLGNVLSSGILSGDGTPTLQVSVETGTLNTVLSPGKALIKGYQYKNTTPKTLVHTIPEVGYDRIDRIVLRWDSRNSVRNILSHVKEGVASATPVAPTLQRDEFIYELSLAQILVRKNTAQLLSTDLIDERLITELCGLVTWLPKVPTDQFQNQWDTFMAGIIDSGFATAAELTALQGQFASHKAEMASQAVGKGASLVGIHDADNMFTATTVEGALKESIAKANSAFTSASNGKTAIGNAVTGVDPTIVIPPEPTFPQLATAISQISTGKKWATGVATSDANGVITVSGLPFPPRTILVRRSADARVSTIYDADASAEYFTSLGANRTVASFGGYVSSSGFKLVVTGGSFADNEWKIYE